MVNFLNKIPLSAKQKDAAVMTALLKEHGHKFYEYDLAARANLREEKYAQLFLNTPPKEPTDEDKEQARKSITTLGELGIRPDEHDTIAISVPVGLNPMPSKEFQAVPQEALAPIPTAEHNPISPREDKEEHETFSLAIELNERQTLAAEFAQEGKCFVLTGAAGTGKTTACREVAKRLLDTGSLHTHDFKLKGGAGRWTGPSIAFCAYTNRAADNMGRALHKDASLEERLTNNILTIHSLLEYEPVFFVREDGTNGMKFEPKRTAHFPLTLTHLVIEESSMLGIDLWLRLFEALPHGCQIIFVGDINQLPPIFSKSILNYALVTLPVVELTEVYRQALDSPIISNAHKALKGEKLQTVDPYFRLLQKKDLKKIPSETFCVNMLIGSLKKWHEQLDSDGQRIYDPEQDIVLSPFNKQDCGTINLNNHIAQFLGTKRNAMVYEIIAGMSKRYLAVGDRVMVDKQDGYVTRIVHNMQYVGRVAQPASTELSRFGVRILTDNALKDDEDFELEGYENLNVDALPNEDEDTKKRAASHIVDVLLDNGRTDTLSSSGDFADSVFSLGYALTVHKAQGCEWRKVIILLHRNHAVLLNRELIYTAITRAREYCWIVDLCATIDRAISNQKIKGDTVQDKIEWFNSEVSLEEPVPVIP